MRRPPPFRERPLARLQRIIGEVPSGEIDRAGAAIVNLDPVGGVSVAVAGVPVGGHELRNDYAIGSVSPDCSEAEKCNTGEEQSGEEMVHTSVDGRRTLPVFGAKPTTSFPVEKGLGRKVGDAAKEREAE